MKLGMRCTCGRRVDDGEPHGPEEANGIVNGCQRCGLNGRSDGGAEMAAAPLAEQPRTRHPSIEAVLQFFAWSHLPPHLQAVSRPFGDMALQIANTTSNAETTVALRKLLEAKDAAVRAVLFKEPSKDGAP